MDWLLLTGISATSRAIYSVMTKVLSNKLKVSAYTQAALLPLAAAFITLIVSLFFGGIDTDFSQVSIVALLLVVFGQGLGNIAYFGAMKDLTSSTAQIAFSSILFFNTFLALLFLDLSLNLVNVIGLMLLMLAILSVTTGKVELHKKGVALMVFAALLFSVFQLASAELSQQVGATTYLLIAYLGAALVVLLIKWRLIVKDLSSADLRITLGIPLLTAIPSLGNFFFAYHAYRNAPEPAKVAMLLTSQVVLTVLFSYLFLKERGYVLRKIGAALLVVVAAILIKS